MEEVSAMVCLINSDSNNNDDLPPFWASHVSGPMPKAFSIFPHSILTVTWNISTLLQFLSMRKLIEVMVSVQLCL